MQTAVKILLSVIIILAATFIGKKLPSAAGLISVMPLTGALILVWVHIENKGDPVLMRGFARGAIWGILPSVLFYLVAYLCFRKELPLAVVLTASFGIWILGALVHQWLLR